MPFIRVSPAILDYCRNPQLEASSFVFDAETGVIQHPDEVMTEETLSVSLPEGWIALPGFVDAHCHLPQYPACGLYRPNLLEWLQTYILPSEARFQDPLQARQLSRSFYQALLKQGITTAAVFPAPFVGATNVAFQEAELAGIRVVLGLNLMDTGSVPEGFPLNTAEELLQQTEFLYQRWHGQNHGKLNYAFLPRFPLSCSWRLLKGIGELLKRYPEARLHTHLAEQRDETEAVLAAYPEREHYLDVYDSYGLVTEQSFFAHSIHLSAQEWALLSRRHAAVVHCPSANQFLKSGTFNWTPPKVLDVPVGLGSDVGAGPLLNPWAVMRDAHWMQPLEQTPSVAELFQCATQGGASALKLGAFTGKLRPGYAADFILVNTNRWSELASDNPLFQADETAWLKRPLSWQERLTRLLFTQYSGGVEATFIEGQLCYHRTSEALELALEPWLGSLPTPRALQEPLVQEATG
jgi:guanine deaminase